MKAIRSHTQLDVYREAFDLAHELFEISRQFPKEELYSLTDQIRRSSRSICANLAEAFRKRRYEAHFVSKLSDSEAEAAETQVWIQFAHKSGYLNRSDAARLFRSYDRILAKIVSMIVRRKSWLIPS